MKKVVEAFDEILAAKPIFDSYFGDFSFAVFDIETTGFSSQRDSVILTGSVVSKDADLSIHQFFAESPGDEKEIIVKTIDLIENVDFIITFNGKFFDVPFMRRRAEKYGLSFPEKYNLDLFTLFKYYSELSTFLSSLSQKSIEEYAGISGLREDRITGGESVELFLQYQTAFSTELESKILLHNKDDVKQLYRLIPLLRNTYLHRALTKNGFPISAGVIKSISYKNGDVLIKGACFAPLDYIKFPTADEPYSFRMSSSDGSFEISVPCEKEKNVVYLDALSLLGERMKKLESHPGFSSGYLIIKEAQEVNYKEINLFSKELIDTVFTEIGIGRLT